MQSIEPGAYRLQVLAGLDYGLLMGNFRPLVSIEADALMLPLLLIPVTVQLIILPISDLPSVNRPED